MFLQKYVFFLFACVHWFFSSCLFALFYVFVVYRIIDWLNALFSYEFKTADVFCKCLLALCFVSFFDLKISVACLASGLLYRLCCRIKCRLKGEKKAFSFVFNCRILKYCLGSHSFQLLFECLFNTTIVFLDIILLANGRSMETNVIRVSV